MDLKTYIADMDRRIALAASLGRSPMYLWQIANGWRNRRASTALAIEIEEHTQRIVRKETLRPDVWGNARTTDRAESTG